LPEYIWPFCIFASAGSAVKLFEKTRYLKFYFIPRDLSYYFGKTPSDFCGRFARAEHASVFLM